MMTIKKSSILNKQKKISFDKGFPANSFGEDGDMTVRLISGLGLFLFIKVYTKWYQTRLSLFRPKGSENNEPVIVPVGRVPKRVGELSMDTSTKLRVGSGDSSNKQVVGINSSKVLDISNFILTRAEDDSSGDNFTIRNTGAGRAYLHVQTNDNAADPYLLLSYKAAGSLNQWCFGMDNSDSDTLKWLKKSHASPLTPSDDAFGGAEDVIKMALDTSGNLRTKGTITSSAGACSGTGALDAANGVDNRVSTFTDANSLNGEANLLFDGTGLKIGEQSGASADTAAYGQLWVKNSDPNELMFTDGDGKDIPISNMVRYVSHNYSNRMSSVNSWYAGYFLNMGTSISASDWTHYHSYLSSIMIATTPCQVKQITISCAASSQETYEIEIWDVTIPTDGALAPSTAAKIGDTIQVNGGSNMNVNALYNVVHPCNHDLAAGHSMHIATRYTDGSGAKSFYYWLTAEIVETS